MKRHLLCLEIMTSTAKVLEANADPDYENVQDESLGEINESLQREDARDQAVQKIQNIIHEQFSFEIDLKEKEVSILDCRVHECRTSLDRLRACILAGYYGYGSLPASGGLRTERTRTPKTRLKERDIMNWKRSLPSNLKEQPADENLSHRNQRSETGNSCMQTSNCSTGKFGDTKTPSLFAPDKSNSSAQLKENESRFYVKRRIIIGNTSKYILPEHREGNDRSTHKWMVYVRGPKDDSELHNFISKVWFLLHPSYQPNDLVEVSKPPFQVTRRGWGEFPVRVQLHFVENKNKRVDIIHHLKLDKTYTGLQTLGAETHVDIELDRKNFDGSNSCKPSKDDNNKASPHAQTTAPVGSGTFDLASHPKLEKNEEIMDQKTLKVDKYGLTSDHCMLNDHSYSTVGTEDKSLCQNDMKYLTPPPSVPGSTCSAPKSSRKLPQSFAVRSHVEQESEMLLQKLVQQFPIVRAGSMSSKPGYGVSNLDQFLSWNLGKRLAAEWQRALALKVCINKQSLALPSLSTKNVMNYCRFHGYTPLVDVSTEGKTVCKFCGDEIDSNDCDEAMLVHQDCASDYEENEISGTCGTAQEFLEFLTESEISLEKRDARTTEEIVDVVGVTHEQLRNPASLSRPIFLPVTEELEWVKETTAEIDVSLTNLDIDGVHAPVTSAMLYKASSMFVEDIVRKANRFTWKSSLQIPKAKCILPLHVKKAVEAIPHCDFLTNNYLKVELDTAED